MENTKNTGLNFFKDFIFKIQAEPLISSAYLLGLFIKIEEDGLISDVLFNDNVYNLDFNHVCGQNIHDFYFLPEDKTIADLSFHIDGQGDKIIQKWIFSSAHTYASKNVFEKFEDFFGFYTNVPFSRLSLLRIKNTGLFGAIRYNDFSTRIVSFRQSPLLFLDINEEIQGYNQALLNLFPDKKMSGRNLLDRPAKAFFDPHPLDLLKNKEAHWTEIQELDWELSYALDFQNSEPSEMEQYIETRELKKRGEQWVWEPEQARNRLLALLPTVDLTKRDIKIELTVSLDRGCLPYFILGGEAAHGQFFPDYKGYLIGYHDPQKKALLKKTGEVIHEVFWNYSLLTDECKIEVFKRGGYFALFINGLKIFGYTDFEPVENPVGHQYLYLEEAGNVILKSLKVYGLPVEEINRAPANEITLRNNTENTYRFRQISDDHFTFIQGRFHYVFTLEDISHLKKNIQILKKESEKMARERDALKSLALGQSGNEHSFIGESAVINSIKEKAKAAAEYPVAILIEGETGTGKEVLARYIHENSLFCQGPFVKVDCAALPSSLLESELFGFERGAFTGAERARAGKLEAAEEGTLFLDEIGNIPLATQAKLLNFLQDFIVERIGSNKKINVHTRIIAAANQPLQQMVDEERFRKDLYYRLNTFHLTLPPLREHKEDIPPLSLYFLNRTSKKYNRSCQELAVDSYQKLLAYNWPGNVRELEHVIEKAVLLCNDKEIDAKHIEMIGAGEGIKTKNKPTIPVGDARAMRPEHIHALLEKHNGIIDRAAREAKISKATFFRKLKDFKIDAKKWKKGGSQPPKNRTLFTKTL